MSAVGFVPSPGYVHRLPSNHARYARVARNRFHRQHAGAIPRLRQLRSLTRHQLHCRRQQPIARQNRHVLAELAVICQLTAPQVIVVHRRQVVVNQAVCVNHFQRTGKRQRLSRITTDGLA